jgi:hypothetical protein
MLMAVRPMDRSANTTANVAQALRIDDRLRAGVPDDWSVEVIARAYVSEWIDSPCPAYAVMLMSKHSFDVLDRLLRGRIAMMTTHSGASVRTGMLLRCLTAQSQ